MSFMMSAGKRVIADDAVDHGDDVTLCQTVDR
jgi:hypothetical protein